MESATLKLLEHLEKIFPKDLVTNSHTLGQIGAEVETITTLERNKLIEKVPRGTPGMSSALSYRITSLGIQFLNQARQKRTNDLLIILTVVFTAFSLVQLVLMLFK